MNTVVGKLLDVDRQARQLLDDARQYYEKTIDEIDKEKEQMLQNYTQRAEKHIQDVRDRETAGVEEAIAGIKAESEKKNRDMEEIFKKNHEQWEKEMFERCVKQVTPDA